MTEQYFMKALDTFYGTGGYIVKGQDFYVSDKGLADFYAKEGKAVYTDGNSVEDDTKIYTPSRAQNNVYYTNQLERNVTSLANPINLKLAVEGINPEDLSIEVVRGEELNSSSQATHQVQPQENQNYQAQNQQSYQPQYQTQNQQPQSQSSSSDSQLMEELKHLQEEHHKQMELVRQLEEKINQLSGGSSSSNQNQAQPQQNNDQPVFEIRHVGGGWYDLPNGERVQGKENAENRVREIANAAQQANSSQNQANFSQNQGNGNQSNQNGFTPNQERVRQANVNPEDGAQLNQAQLNTYQQGQFNNGGEVIGAGNPSATTNQPQVRDENGQFAEAGRVQNANTQPRNSEGEFVESSGGFTTGRGGVAGATGGSTAGASTAGNTGGSAGTGGATSGPNSSSGGGASTAGNTNQ